MPPLGRAPFFILALLASPASAQRLPGHVPPSTQPTQSADACCLIERITGAAVGAAFGGVVGAYALGHLGYALAGGSDICGDDACGFVGAILGALVGESLGIGLGAHLGGGRRGELAAPVAASLGILLLSGMVSQYVNFDEPVIYVVPVAQVIAAVWAELATQRDRRDARD